MKIKCISKSQLLKVLPGLSAALSKVSDHGMLPIESIALQSELFGVNAVIKISAGFDKPQKVAISEYLYNSLLNYDIEDLTKVHYDIESDEISENISPNGWNESNITRDNS
tara:strand:+ start:3361 stop:3693 length:333 start_codon:yes stop_codon:yes gene_type:complete